MLNYSNIPTVFYKDSGSVFSLRLQIFHKVKSSNAFFKKRIPSPIKSVRNPGKTAIAVAIAKATAICTPLSSPNIQKQIVAPYTITPKSHPIPEITLPKNDRTK